ncbi:DSC E3 ubiquitin ligase complex subunit 1 isoform X1 [Amborella trichopoda]|nr:DSC E3 ubiquitin ligase complex subunit 1 isoform X1 [Amborella trichopoda]XP_020528438.1 DSC E3 ubiquitin ligase complex subunit 1 isoform X1 [Amborella trichopoda]|eukprot:XP_006853553.3 DSC E3 ubiquitin ligase complex subunit 1 isoform X1 [Amborella trichopoda]
MSWLNLVLGFSEKGGPMGGKLDYWQNIGFLGKNVCQKFDGRRGLRLLLSNVIIWFCVIFNSFGPVMALRPLREKDSSWSSNQHLLIKREDRDFSPYIAWNITGTYRGTWGTLENNNGSHRFPEFGKSNGYIIFELVSSVTKITGVHYVQGAIFFRGASDNEHDPGVTQLRVEGVYIWPFRQLRMVTNSGPDGGLNQEEDYFLSNPYHLLGLFSSQVFQDSPREQLKRKGKHAFLLDLEKHCNLQIAAQISKIPSDQRDGDRDHYHMEGLVESPALDDEGECFSPILLNASSISMEVYYNKAVNYTLMVTFISFLQVLLLIRQMEHSSTQSGAAKVSLLMIGQQAIMDAYLCLLHLTAGILVESLFNAFATAAFFKFVVFSIFEMRYLLAIWKAGRPNTGEGWETMRRELSILYSRFYGILLGGIIIMYELHSFLRPILLAMYSFWIPQIIFNVIRDTRKPLHPHYILGMTFTRLAIPMYAFGCPSNFMRIEVDKNWCMCLGLFMGFQALVLLLQHYLGSRWFIPRQILPEKYSYYRRFENNINAVDCVICMTSIDVVQRSNECMVTPCDHFFHSGCLQRWMDIKMECPTCRRPLPPV